MRSRQGAHRGRRATTTFDSYLDGSIREVQQNSLLFHAVQCHRRRQGKTPLSAMREIAMREMGRVVERTARGRPLPPASQSRVEATTPCRAAATITTRSQLRGFAPPHGGWCSRPWVGLAYARGRLEEVKGSGAEESRAATKRCRWRSVLQQGGVGQRHREGQGGGVEKTGATTGVWICICHVGPNVIEVGGNKDMTWRHICKNQPRQQKPP
jgi:hypothetical protein